MNSDANGQFCNNDDHLAQLRHISETRLVDVIEIMKEGCFNVAMNELLCIKQEIDQELEGEK